MKPLALLVMLSACAGADTTVDSADDAALRVLLRLPEAFELPAIPEANPLTAEKITLGRALFHERRLSANGTQSCEDCHHRALAFSDGLATPVGSTGQPLVRNSQGLANVAYTPTLTWASNSLLTIEEQLHIPLSNDAPIELGITDGARPAVLQRFIDDPAYAAMFAAAFPSVEGVTLDMVRFALASFVRTFISGASPYDRYLAGDKTALTDQQKEGAGLFFGENFECFHCHTGTLFSVAYRDANEESATIAFFNNGLYNVDGGYPASDQGLYDLTFDPNDRGMFKPPSLRNVALTAPYMHDGSIKTLEQVVRHYVAGGRLITEGPDAGDGRKNPLKSDLVRPFLATEAEIAAVVAFLGALTDDTFVTNAAFASPN